MRTRRVTGQFEETPLHQDPLLPVSGWPGVRFHYRFEPGTNDSASLVLEGGFDLDSIAPSDPPASSNASVSLEEQWSAIAQHYRVIVDQLRDPNTVLTVSTTLAGGTLTGSDSIAASLLVFAQTILAEVSAAASTSPSLAPKPRTFSASAPVAFSALVALPLDTLPAGVTVTLAREKPSLVDLRTRANMPAVALITASPLPAFAIEFEKAFTNYDGAGGMLKLARRADGQSSDDPSQIEKLWVVRWSAKAGISVAFTEPFAYFGLKPMSKTLLSVRSDDFAIAGADLDLLARQFVAAFDAFLSPTVAAAIAILDVRQETNHYDAITTAKKKLATTIPLGLGNVFAAQIGMGSLPAAQERLTQALLGGLANAFDFTTIVQAPATTQAAGTYSPAAAQAPMLFGEVGPIISDSSAAASPADAQTPYTLTPGKLAIGSGTSSPGLTSRVTVAQPGQQKALNLPLTYDITYLQHDPSSFWLKFLRPGDSALRIPIAENAGIPIPLSFAPTPPSLNAQSASASPLSAPGSPSIQDGMAAALRWEYQLDIIPNWSAQDDLFFEIKYDAPSPASDLQAQANDSPEQGRIVLLKALHDFLRWYQENVARFSTIVEQACASGADPNGPAQLVATFAEKSEAVASAWAGLHEPTKSLAEFAEEQIVDRFQLLRGSKSPQTISLSAMANIPNASNPAYWPTVTVYNGNESESWTPDGSQAQPATSPNEGWWVLSHTFSVPSFDRLGFTFEGIDLQQRQNAIASAHIRRNADLVADNPTNADFVLETETVSFPSSVSPLIHHATLPTVQPHDAGLQQTLIDIFTLLTRPAARWESTLRVGAEYSWELAVPQNGEPALRTFQAILLSDGLDFQNTPVEEIAGHLAQEIANWHRATAPSQQGALLNLAVTVFAVVAGELLPVIQLDQIPVDVSGVSNTWWSQTAGRPK